jgi:hypothetical protein
MEWEVVLRGPEPILEVLAHVLRCDENTIIRSTDGFLLRSSRFVNAADAADVRSKATAIEALSGISRMLLQSDAPLGIASLIESGESVCRNFHLAPMDQIDDKVLEWIGQILTPHFEDEVVPADERSPGPRPPTRVRRSRPSSRVSTRSSSA